METLLILAIAILVLLWLWDCEVKQAKIAALEHEVFCLKTYGVETVENWDIEAHKLTHNHYR